MRQRNPTWRSLCERLDVERKIRFISSPSDMVRKRPPDGFPARNQFDRGYLKKGKHSTFLFLPVEFHALIGLVVAHWGMLESMFNVSLGALVNGEAEDGGVRKTAGWMGFEFRRRRELFKDICREWLSAIHPDEAKELVAICDRAADLRWRRDMIAHGVYAYSILPYSSTATNFRAINDRTGDKMPFDEHILKKLYHDISHLTADLLLTFKSIGEVESPFVAIPDTELLRLFREFDRRNRANVDS